MKLHPMLSLGLFISSQNPTIGDRMYDELQSVLGDNESSGNSRTPTVRDIPKLVILRRFLENQCDYIHQHGQ